MRINETRAVANMVEDLESKAGGTTNYEDLQNKPSINGVSLSGNKTSSDLGLQGSYTAGDNISIENNEISVTGILPETKNTYQNMINGYAILVEQDTSMEPVPSPKQNADYAYCMFQNSSNTSKTFTFHITGKNTSGYATIITAEGDGHGTVTFIDDARDTNVNWNDHISSLTINGLGVAIFNFTNINEVSPEVYVIEESGELRNYVSYVTDRMGEKTAVTIGERLASSTVGEYSLAVGRNTQASANSCAFNGGKATGTNSVAMLGGTASGTVCLAAGSGATASGNYTSAIGSNAKASASYATAIGYGVSASGDYSGAFGNYTIAQRKSQSVRGEFNVADATGTTSTRGDYADIVGNGTGSNANKRSNAYTLDWDGNGWFSGNVYIGSTSGTNKDAGSKILATQEYVDTHSPSVVFLSADYFDYAEPGEGSTEVAGADNLVLDDLMYHYVGKDSLTACPTAFGYNDSTAGLVTLCSISKMNITHGSTNNYYIYVYKVDTDGTFTAGYFSKQGESGTWMFDFS